MAEESAQPKHEPFIAIDIGAYSVKFVFLEYEDDGSPTLKTLAQILIPSYEKNIDEEKREQMSRDDVKEYCLKELRQLLTTKITELLYDNEIQTKKAITFASNREVTIRCIEVPPANEKEKDKFSEAVTQEANKQMPFSMGNAVLGYTLGDTVSKEGTAVVQIMAAALQKDTIEFINANLKASGDLINDGIITLPQALELSLKEQMEPFASDDKKIAIIHSGHTTTSVMIYKNGKIQFYRDINMAGATITDAIFAGGEIDGQPVKPSSYAEATELKHSIGVIPPDDIDSLKGLEKFAATKIFESVEKIFQNIQLSISFYISQSGESKGLDQIILTGGSSFMKNYKEFIEESLEVPTSLAKPFASMTIGEIKYDEEKCKEDSAALSPVLGVALYKSQPDKIINFLDVLFPNRSKKTSTSPSINFSGVSSKFGSNFNNLGAKLFQLEEKNLRILAGILLGLVALITALPVIMVNRRLNNVKNEYKRLERELNRLKGEQSEINHLLNEQKNLEKLVSVADELRNYRVLNSKLLIKLLSLVPKEIFITNAEFNLKNITPSLTLQGHADNSDSVFQFLAVMSKDSIFQKPALKSTQEVEIDDKRYFIKFSMQSEINSEELHIKEEENTEKDDDETIEEE